MNTTSDPPAEDDALWNYYTDKFNFTVDWVPLQYAERFDKLRIWICLLYTSCWRPWAWKSTTS